MAPARDDDLDWLYGREHRPDAGPEPTRALPPTPPAATGRPADHDPSSRPADPPPSAPGPVRPVLPPPPVPGSRTSRPRRRHPVRVALGLVGVLLLAYAVWLVAVPAHAYGHVQRVDDAPAGTRPTDQPGTTFLLVGSDSRAGLTKAQRKALGTGDAAGQRTDTIMLLYIPTSGKPALISIPRDSYVPIPGHGSNKINAAYAFGGPKLLVRTVEQNTGLRVDDYLEIGFGGFVSIIDSLGGIEMCLPKAIKDTDSHINLPKGCQTLDGANALGYVRERHADALGDLGRVQRQRAMLAAVAKKSVSARTLLDPVRYWNLSKSTTAALTLGQQTSLHASASLALAMRKVSGDQGFTLTVPIGNADATTSAGSSVLWDDAKAKKMFADIAAGDTSGLSKYAQ